MWISKAYSHCWKGFKYAKDATEEFILFILKTQNSMGPKIPI